MKMIFRNLAHGQKFKSNGVEFVKKTSRTARMISNRRAFYFGAYEQCEIIPSNPAEQRGMLDTESKMCYN